jgi:hypothetical protein
VLELPWFSDRAPQPSPQQRDQISFSRRTVQFADLPAPEDEPSQIELFIQKQEAEAEAAQKREPNSLGTLVTQGSNQTARAPIYAQDFQEFATVIAKAEKATKESNM